MMNGGINCMMGGGLMMAGMVVELFLFLGLLVAAGLAIIGLLRRTQEPPRPADTPYEILQRRFAHGEITAEQYAQLKEKLRVQ